MPKVCFILPKNNYNQAATENTTPDPTRRERERGAESLGKGTDLALPAWTPSSAPFLGGCRGLLCPADPTAFLLHGGVGSPCLLPPRSLGVAPGLLLMVQQPRASSNLCLTCFQTYPGRNSFSAAQVHLLSGGKTPLVEFKRKHVQTIMSACLQTDSCTPETQSVAWHWAGKVACALKCLKGDFSLKNKRCRIILEVRLGPSLNGRDCLGRQQN